MIKPVFGRIDWRALFFALTAGSLGGAAFTALDLPLAWMIGAMTATTILAVGGVRVAVPMRLRSAMIMILGIMLGSAFTPEILEQIGRWAVSLGVLVVYMFSSAFVGTLFLRRVVGYDPVTAYFAATPGGLSEMVLVGGALGGDEREISLCHGIRVMLVVMALPFWFQFVDGYDASLRTVSEAANMLGVRDALLLGACVVGAPLAGWLRLPAAALVGPMIFSAAIHLSGLTTSRPPVELIAVAQIVVGSAIGARFVGVGLARLGRAAVIASALTALMLLVAVMLAMVLGALTGISLPALILAYSPGGLAEMSLTALALGVDVAFVSTHHIVRIILIVTLAPAVFRLLHRSPIRHDRGIREN